ncbi:MAG: S8 family serine peptidase, partial [Delftia sp.]|nr:S8 family serine peptidase [Delftia sp.]
AAGIFVIFSSGNDGPNLRTVGSPASLPGSFAVGASDPDDEIASFSSRGPSPWGEVRPHVVAPGINVYSALSGGVYGEKQGTSMAAPHATGAVALMLSAQPDLSITRTAYILTSTAFPLSDVIPNNNMGYGLIDAYAAVALAANAGLISGTISGAGQPIAGAAIQAIPSQDVGGSALPGRATNSDASGHYKLFLGAGYYDLAISAFAHAPAQMHALAVITGATTTQDFDLTALPSGQVQGTVTALDGKAVSATVSALGAPVTATTDGGDYTLTLPVGDHTLEARALGYHVLTASVSVAADQVSHQHFVLSDTIHVLLVDGGSRYYDSQINYYRQALDDLHYAYDVKRVKHLPDATLAFTTFQPYDLLIWSAPSDSPGKVGAASALTAYLLDGGNLLLSGQEVANWDGDGKGYSAYYFDHVYSAYQSDNAPSRQIICLDDSAFGGLTLTIEGDGGADNQRWPDEIKVHDSDHASLACNYQGG